MFRNHVNQHLSAYLHGELSQEEARRVVEHLHACQQCRAEYEEVEFGAQMAAQLARVSAPESLWGELEAAINRGSMEQQKSRARRSWLTQPSMRFAAVAVLVLLLGGAAFWVSRRNVQPELGDQLAGVPSWEVTRLEGRPAIGRRKIDEKGRLAVGESLVTDGAARAQISVGQIGEVKIEPNSHIRLVSAQDDQHRLALTRGKMEAFIWAPPRQFFVDTPSAVAVDLGCSYTLEVGDDGQGFLRVTMGWVAFEWQGRESFVPAGAVCATTPGRGPGTPYFNDAPAELQSALLRFDAEPKDASALAAVLAAARKQDALTLWHLLTRTEREQCDKVFDRLSDLVAPPPHVTRAGILRRDRVMLDAWWGQLGMGDSEWWRIWKGPLPTQAK